MGKYVRYYHHGSFVWVREDLKGRHRRYSCCWACARMKLDDRKGNCRAANLLYALCILLGTVLVVWECPWFVPREGRVIEVGDRVRVEVNDEL